MASDSIENGLHEQNLPDGHWIFDLITSNNLGALRSILTPLTLSDRQSIVYQKVGKKSLLCYACQLGFRDIVKYLLDECGADIDDCYCNSRESVPPMRIAIKKLDVFLITILKRRGATVGRNILETVSADTTSNKGYNTLVSILRLYKSRLDSSNFVVMQPEKIKYNGLFEFSWAAELAHDIRSEDFLAAAARGNVARMKILLECGVNKDRKNDCEEDALSVTIMKEQTNAMHFLINHKIFSIKSYAQALELCGAKFILFRSEKQKGLKCWRKSIRIRQEYCIGFADKIQMSIETDLGMEFQTEEEIDRLQKQSNGDLYLQALIIFRRLLSRLSLLTLDAFVIVAQHQSFKGDLLKPLKILSELHELPSRPDDSIRCPTYRAVNTIRTLFLSNFLCYPDDKTDFIRGFGRLIDFLNVWRGLLWGGFEFYRIAYGELLDVVLGFIYNMDRYDLSAKVIEWIEQSVGEILQRCSYPYPTTLIHRAIKGDFPVSVVSFLLQCSADANCTDALKNTPLHLVSSMPRERAHLSSLTRLLIDSGGHIDSVNKFGKRPLEILKSRRVIQNPHKFLSLQCLAAQVIHKNKIAVSEKTYPKILVKFIKLHSSIL